MSLLTPVKPPLIYLFLQDHSTRLFYTCLTLLYTCTHIISSRTPAPANTSVESLYWVCVRVHTKASPPQSSASTAAAATHRGCGLALSCLSKPVLKPISRIICTSVFNRIQGGRRKEGGRRKDGEEQRNVDWGPAGREILPLITLFFYLSNNYSLSNCVMI